LVTTSIDQRLNYWKLMNSEIQLKKSYFIEVSDISCMSVLEDEHQTIVVIAGSGFMVLKNRQ